jgi:hypothetical protein
MVSPKPDKPPKPAQERDIERVEADYSAGILTVREIGKIHGISHSLILRWAKQRNWTRNLRAKIQAKAADLVTKQAVTKSVTKAVTERQVVDASAAYIADVLLTHKAGSARVTTLGLKLLAEVESQTEDHAAYELVREIALKAAKDDPVGRASVKDAIGVFDRVVSLPGRLDAARKAAEIVQTGIATQRRANNIGDDSGNTSGRPLVTIRDFTGRGDPDAPPRDDESQP